MSISIQLRIVKDNVNSLKDEIFTISKGHHDDWCINHRSYFSQTNSSMYLKSRADVLNYLYHAFDIVKVDTELFHSVQFDAPCYPVVMVSRKDILCIDTMHTFMRVVDQVLNNWPTSCRPWSP
jgi:hypothetical protein